MNHFPGKFTPDRLAGQRQFVFPIYRPRSSRAFTLVELLVVIGIIIVMFGLAIPAVNGLKNAGDVSKSVYDIAGILDQARAYAMSKNTYVYVGITEADNSKTDSGTQTAGVGRIAVAAMASKDGTAPVSGTSLVPTNLVALQKLQRFENLHLADFAAKTATHGPMADRKPIVAAESLGNDDTNEATGVNWPIGSTGTAKQYTFYKLIRFSPQGVASLQKNTSLPAYLEIGLQQTHGNVSPTAPTDLSTTNVAAIQIDGIIGASRIYRP